jgi:hypothetical protein
MALAATWRGLAVRILQNGAIQQSSALIVLSVEQCS